MKTFAVCMMLMMATVTNGQSISLRLGQSLAPAGHVSLRYEHWTNSSVNLSFGGFYEQNLRNQLRSSMYGADLLAEVASNREGYSAGVFGLRGGVGATWNLEKEPWLYKDWPAKKRMNYGIAAEASAEFFMTENFTMRATFQQKILFNPLLERYRCLIGLGLVYHLSSL